MKNLILKSLFLLFKKIGYHLILHQEEAVNHIFYSENFDSFKK